MKKVFVILVIISQIAIGQTNKKLHNVCPGEKGVLYGIESPNPTSTYFWTPIGGEISSYDNDKYDDTVIINWEESSEDIQYSLSVVEYSEFGCYGDTVSVDIGFIPYTKVSLLDGAPSKTICDGDMAELDAGDGFFSYNWGSSNGDDVEGSRTFYVAKNGLYWVNVVSDSGCQSADTVKINIKPLPDVEIAIVGDSVDLGDRLQICNETVELDAGDYTDYNWSTGSIERYIEFTEQKLDTLIWVEATDFFGCKGSDSLLIEKCTSAINAYSAFTPNGDGVNETWIIEGIDNFENAVVRVFNRKKVLVFESRGAYQPWNGKASNGKLLPVDSYHYIIDLKEPGYKNEQGFVTIIY